jgi:hypothetical protein
LKAPSWKGWGRPLRQDQRIRIAVRMMPENNVARDPGA